MTPISPLSTATEKNQDVFEAAQRKTALKGIERLFAKLLLDEMRKTVPEGGLFGGDFAARMQSEFFDDALSEAIADTGQFGIAKTIDAQLHMAENAPKPNGDRERSAYLPLSRAAALSSPGPLVPISTETLAPPAR